MLGVILQWRLLKGANNMKSVFLYGASGHAKVIIDILTAQGIEVSGLIDDNPDLNELMGIRVYHEVPLNDSLIISIGSNSIRKMISEKLNSFNFATAIHPSAIISSNSALGVGSVVMQGAIIQSSATVGRHCIINTAASVDHDCFVDDYVHISPHATLCGNVFVGEGSQVGAGAIVIPGIKIGKWSLVAAGAVVMRDVPNNVLVMGNPDKEKKKLI